MVKVTNYVKVQILNGTEIIMTKSSKKIKPTEQVQQLKACLVMVQDNLKMFYQERIPHDTKYALECLFKDIQKVLDDSE